MGDSGDKNLYFSFGGGGGDLQEKQTWWSIEEYFGPIFLIQEILPGTAAEMTTHVPHAQLTQQELVQEMLLCKKPNQQKPAWLSDGACGKMSRALDFTAS